MKMLTRQALKNLILFGIALFCLLFFCEWVRSWKVCDEVEFYCPRGSFSILLRRDKLVTFINIFSDASIPWGIRLKPPNPLNLAMYLTPDILVGRADMGTVGHEVCGFSLYTRSTLTDRYCYLAVPAWFILAIAGLFFTSIVRRFWRNRKGYANTAFPVGLVDGTNTIDTSQVNEGQQ